MSTFESSAKVFGGGILASLICVALSAWAAAQEKTSPPDFSSNEVGWLTFNVDFSIVPGGTSPLHTDPAYPRVSNQESARTANNRTTLSRI
jgi:hypothetical protein